MRYSEETIEVLEQQFPSLSGSAFSAAYNEALGSGHSVYVADGEWVYEVFPNGNRKKIKQIDPPTQVNPGTTITLP